MTTTPTNEAGHGLPELPEPLISGGNDNSRPDLGRGCTGYTAAQVQQYAIDYAAALALSRGVPADMDAFRHAASRWQREADYHASGFADDYAAGQRHAFFSCAKELRAIIETAPAATGAQGEAVCPNCDGRGEVGGPVGQTAETFDYVTEPCPECTPQPAAADGGVRERARELLAVELEHDGFAETAYAVRSGWNVHQQAPALRVIEALSSHRQAGDELRAPVGDEAMFLESDVHEMLQNAYRLALPPAGDQARAPNQIAAADWIMKHEGYRAARTVLALNMARVKPKCVWPNCVCDSPSTDGCGQDSVWGTSEECTLVEKGAGS